MDFKIERIKESNYCLFDDMVFWRENGFEREVSQDYRYIKMLIV
ncbi:MAG: hypothetical protein Q4F05_15960 [bacterium]|nr:hypothetical protein [bacterium]